MAGKLRLDLDQLAVDTFDTTAREKKEKGTVFGEQCTCPTACTCPGCPTCDASCNGTCGEATCAASCYGSCGATCDYTCEGCTFGDITCGNITTCNPMRICYDTP